MKQFATKSGPLSLVPSATERTDSSTEARSATEARANVLKESFDDWRSSVAPTLLQPKHFEDEPKHACRSQRRLSSTEIMHVNRATIRESHEPRAWPPEVVLRFLAAEVIKRNQ